MDADKSTGTAITRYRHQVDFSYNHLNDFYGAVRYTSDLFKLIFVAVY